MTSKSKWAVLAVVLASSITVPAVGAWRGGDLRTGEDPTDEYETWKQQERTKFEGLISKGQTGRLTASECKDLWQTFKYRATSGTWLDTADVLDAHKGQYDPHELAKDVEAHWLKHAACLARMHSGDMKFLYKALSRLSLQASVSAIGVEWISVAENWKQVSHIDHYATVWKRVLSGESEQISAARRVVATHIFDEYLSVRSQTKSMNLGERFRFIKEIFPYLTEKQRNETEHTLRTLGQKPELLRELSAENFKYLKWFMMQRSQESEFVTECAARWMNISHEWMTLDTEHQEWLSLVLRFPSDASLRCVATEAIVRALLHLQRPWEAKDYARDAIDWARSTEPSDLSNEDLRALCKMIELLDLQADRVEAVAWRRMFELREISASPCEDRLVMWREILAGARSWRTGRMSGAVLFELDAAIAASRGCEALPVGRMLRDLIDLSTDQLVTTPELYRRLRWEQLRIASRSLSPEARKSITVATGAYHGGRRSEAIASLREAMAAGSMGQGAKNASYRCLLPLLLASRPFQATAAEECIEALAGDLMSEPDMWNYACEALLLKIGETEKAARQEAWTRGVLALSAGDPWFSQRLLNSVRRTVDLLEQEGDRALAHVILADLLAATADIHSMCRLQVDRAALFARAKAWDEAFAAAKLALVLAVATEQGPRPVADHLLDVLVASGASSIDLQRFKTAVCWPDRHQRAEGDSSTETAEVPGASGSIVDEKLTQASAVLLARCGERLPIRRTAILHLLSGDVTSALNAAGRAMVEAESATNEVLTTLDCTAAILGVADRGIHDAFRFSYWLAQQPDTPVSGATYVDDPRVALLAKRWAEMSGRRNKAMDITGHRTHALDGERHAAFASACRQQIDRWGRWGIEALSDGDQEWGAAFWASAITNPTSPQDVASVMSSITDEAQAFNPESAMSTLRTVATRIQSPLGKYYTQAGIARLLYDHSRYSECLAAFTDADRILANAEISIPQDLELGLIRALAMVREQRLDEAVKLLATIQMWQGAAESKAKVLYLVGLVHAKRGEKEHAASALRRLVAEYPESPYKDKAEQYLSHLQGS